MFTRSTFRRTAPAWGLWAALLAAGCAAQTFVDYHKPGELEPLPEGTASLYKVPWRSNVRTVGAHEALEGVGVYYKHVPNWPLEQHVHVMKQMAAAGVRRLRLAPHLAIYISKDWAAPKPQELEVLRNELRGCKAAGIRPCVVFVHIPPIGKPGTRELQEWWRQGELLPAGEVGSEEFAAYLDKTYEALRFVLNEAREAGFADPDSYDLEMGQGLWWGAPAVPRPPPNTTLKDLLPGGRIYEFDVELIRRARKDGYVGPTVWWGQTYHHFEHCSDREVPAEAAGRSISFYSHWAGITTETWSAGTLYDKRGAVEDVWPVRQAPRFLEGTPPRMVLARPEGWMADRTRRDNLIGLLRASATPVAITSLGTVPADIPEADAGGLDGWQLKQRGLTRSLAFWLNQGARFVLLHSAYESKRDVDTHALIPYLPEPMKFTWRQSAPLTTLRAFTAALAGAKKLQELDELAFRYSIQPNTVLIPAAGAPAALTARDAVALLTFQVDERKFAVAAYVVTPNVARPMPPATMSLEVDRRIRGDVAAIRPYTQSTGNAAVVRRGEKSTTLRFEIADDVTWLVFEVE